MTWPIKCADSPEHTPPRPSSGSPPTHKLKAVAPMRQPVRSVDGGYLWDYVGSVASAKQLPWSWYGPNEHDTAVIADGKPLVVVFRPDSDGNCPGLPAYRFYYQTYSFNAGVNWTEPRPVPGVGCVRPRLLQPAAAHRRSDLPWPCGKRHSLSGQRCAPTRGGATGGNFLWVNLDG
jgi:hypothetical protein